jgi:hypothetical protein
MSFLIKYATSAVTFIKESVAIPFNVSDEFVNVFDEFVNVSDEFVNVFE